MNTNFCGAWSLSRRPVRELIDERDWRAMTAQLSPDPSSLRQISDEALLLCAAAGKTARNGSEVVGFEGHIAWGGAGPRDLEDLLLRIAHQEREGLFWNGHYAMAYADVPRRRLSLTCDPSGGERLCFFRSGDLLLFGSSVRPLLAHPRVPRVPDPEAAVAFVLFEETFLPPATMFAGIQEVPAGGRLVAQDGVVALERRPHPQLWPVSTAHPQLWPVSPGEASYPANARRLRRALLDATQLAIGTDKQAVVSLSGGVDSAVLAMLAAEILGPKNVLAYTYDYVDPEHESEVANAAQLCRFLGLEHRVVKLSFRDFFDALPAACWHLEETGHRSGRLNPAKFALARRLGKEGFPKTLTCLGMENLFNCQFGGAKLASLPSRSRTSFAAARVLRNWEIAQFHPGLKRALGPLLKVLDRLTAPAPPWEFYHLVLCSLRHHEAVTGLSGFYPAGTLELAEQAYGSAHVREAMGGMNPHTLEAQLRNVTFSFYQRTRTLSRRVKMSREAGSTLVAPPMFADAVALTPDFACRDAAGRRSRIQGKGWIAEVFRGELPEDIVRRPKLADQAVVTDSWLRRMLEAMEPVVSGSCESFRPHVRGSWVDIQKHFREPFLWLGLWHRIFVETPLGTRPPTWEELTPRGVRPPTGEKF